MCSKPVPCCVKLVGTHRPTGRQFAWPVKAVDSASVGHFWSQMANLAAGLNHELADYAASAVSRADQVSPWGDDPAAAAVLEAGRPAVVS